MNDFRKLSLAESYDFQVEILTNGHWPYQEAPNCKIPKQMQRVQE